MVIKSEHFISVLKNKLKKKKKKASNKRKYEHTERADNKKETKLLFSEDLKSA